MALKLYPPGTRSQTSYVVRGRVRGELFERSLHTTDAKEARRLFQELKQGYAEVAPTKRSQIDFAEAARRYLAYRNPAEQDRRWIERLVGKIGKRPVRQITASELHEAANDLCPGLAGSSKNRMVLRPASAILHYAAENGMCDWLKIRSFPEEPGRTRVVDQDTAARMVELAPAGPKRLLVLWLFHQGMRITHTLNVTWDKIDLDRGTVQHRERKGGRVKDWVFPLHEEVLAELGKVPERERVGRVFPWSHRNGPEKWLKRLGRECGVEFHPHMARHARGTWLNEQGAGLRTIMDALGHSSEKSSLRYQHSNIEVVRGVGARIGLRRGAG